MNCGSERSVSESASDGEKSNESVVEKLGESAVYDNGSYEVENNGRDEDVKGKGAELSSPLVETTALPSSSKGFGLKKWRRINRDAIKVGESRSDTGKMVIQESPESVNPSKRPQVYADRQQKSEGSVSSPNPLVEGLDFLAMLSESGLIVPSFDAGTDSENSEDQSSRSSTAASVPKMKHDMNKTRSLSGKNLTHSARRGQPGKTLAEAVKKSKGEQTKIKEEISRSSMESDSRSSNFIFTLGTHATSNGFRGGRTVHYDGENSQEVKGGEHEAGDGLQDGYRRDNVGGYDSISTESVFVDSYCKVKEENGNNHGSSSNPDPIAESITALQSAQEALEQEVLKFKEMSSNAAVNDSVSDPHQELKELKQKIQEMISEQLSSGEELETAKGYQESEVEYLFKRKIEAEVEYLTISRTIQNLGAAAVNQPTNLEEQNPSASKQNQILRKHGNMKDEAAIPMATETEQSRKSEDLANDNEALKLQKRAWKYTSYLIIELICFLVTLGFFISQLSPESIIEFVPT